MVDWSDSDTMDLLPECRIVQMELVQEPSKIQNQDRNTTTALHNTQKQVHFFGLIHQ